MNKPISMTINETRLSLADICNKSGLPLCVLELIVKGLYDEIKHFSSIQLKQDEEIYNKALDTVQNSNVKQETEQI